MKIYFVSLAFGALCSISCLGAPNDILRFNPSDFKIDSISMPSGKTVKFKAYEGIYYVKNVEDSAYQTLNIYVPLDFGDV